MVFGRTTQFVLPPCVILIVNIVLSFLTIESCELHNDILFALPKTSRVTLYVGKESFERARELFPNSKLLINDYTILCFAGELEVYKEQILILHERGLIDGIGVQAHGLESVLPSTLTRNLDSLAEFGLPIVCIRARTARA